MKSVFYILVSTIIVGCGSGGGGSSADSGETTEIPSPSRFTAISNIDGKVALSWEQSSQFSYDIYLSSSSEFEILNYSIYENSDVIIDVDSPYSFRPDNPAENYTFKLVARSGDKESLPVTVSTYTRFSVLDYDPSTYFDSVLNIQIRRCSEGQEFDYLSESCIKQAVRYTPAELATHLRSIENGWRLPTTAELDGISRCSYSVTDSICVPITEAENILNFFLGSSVAAYYDITALQPHLQDGQYWHYIHGFPDENRIGRINYGSNPDMHAVLVKSAPN